MVRPPYRSRRESPRGRGSSGRRPCPIQPRPLQRCPKAEVTSSNLVGRATLRFCATLSPIGRKGRTEPPITAAAPASPSTEETMSQQVGARGNDRDQRRDTVMRPLWTPFRAVRLQAEIGKQAVAASLRWPVAYPGSNPGITCADSQLLRPQWLMARPQPP